jgi:hypothetical protein
MVLVVAGSFICTNHITRGSYEHMELHEWTLRFVIASFLFHSFVYSIYRYIKGTRKTVPLYVMKEYEGTAIVVPLTGNVSTKRRGVVSFTQRLLYLHRKCPRFPFNRTLDGADSRSVGFGGLNYCPCQESNHDSSVVQP